MTKILYFPNDFRRNSNAKKDKNLDVFSDNFFKKIFKPSIKSNRIVELRELYYYLEGVDVEYRYLVLQAIVEIILKNNLKMPYESTF
jgi:hypothetical protein